MSLIESRIKANQDMQDGLEKIKKSIYANNSNNKNNGKVLSEEHKQAINKIEEGAKKAKDFCNNNNASQKAEKKLEDALKEYQESLSENAMQEVSNAIMDMQRAV